MNPFDPAYSQALPLLVKAARRVQLVLVGTGGTGSWLAPDLARLARAFTSDERRIELTFVDPDIVEERNVVRQNFCPAEVGRAKAVALAMRYAGAWGVEIRAVTEPFAARHVSLRWDTLAIVIGCVDNAAARRSIAECLRHNREVPDVWWVDSGNARETGQVLVGSTTAREPLGQAFAHGTFCQCLPAPSLQESGLLDSSHDEPERSCALADAQSLTINKRMAAEAADYLSRLLGGGPLVKFATYLDLASGTARSRYITPEAVAACGAPVRKRGRK